MLFNLEENASARWLVCFPSLSSYHAKRKKKIFFLRFFDQTLLMMMESSVTVASPQDVLGVCTPVESSSSLICQEASEVVLTPYVLSLCTKCVNWIEHQTAHYRDKYAPFPKLDDRTSHDLVWRKMRSRVKSTMSLTLKEDSETHWCLMTLTGLCNGKLVLGLRSSCWDAINSNNPIIEDKYRSQLVCQVILPSQGHCRGTFSFALLHLHKQLR
ncbi:uncharacterized protein LOC117804235 isoform X2 [Ailuropoda melanoleuca]|uniref:uncharacterized protein LOC117804235 isoform X2 n=1 Tax=Ailuropoda melanoleuca TaxID=9646 RepID=UPI0014945049|nr:uncharacterized protein LOC117804235 isoform X2 [Ailuropoda melanoleuca]